MGGRFEGLEFYAELEFYTLLIEFEEDIACMFLLFLFIREKNEESELGTLAHKFRIRR